MCKAGLAKKNIFFPPDIFEKLFFFQLISICSYSFEVVPFLTLFEWQNIIYFTLEINYFSENRLKSLCSVIIIIIFSFLLSFPP